MAYDVFITYSSKDRKAADAICRALEENRIRCWYAPRNIRSGTSWAAAIIDGLNSSRIMILVWSANSNSSPHVTREVHHAFNKGITVIPFRIEDVEPTQELEYYLESVQWFDALVPPLEDNLKRLVEHIQTILPTDQPSPESDEKKLKAEAEEALAREDAAEEARILAEEEELASQKRAAEKERLRLEEERRSAEEERLRLEAEARQWAEAEAARKQLEEKQAALAAEAQRKQSEEKEAERVRMAEVARAAREKPPLRPPEPTTGIHENQGAHFVRPVETQESLALSQPQPEPTSGKVLRSSGPFALYPSTSPRSFPVWRVVIPGVVVVVLASVVIYALVHGPKDVAQPKQETPTPAPTPPLTPTVNPRPSSIRPTPTPAPTVNPRPSSIRPTPTQPPPEQNRNDAPPARPTPHAPISGGILNGKAVHLVTPPYPAIARSAHASGSVQVQVLIDENGDVISAHAVSGHPLLQAAAVAAARASKFTPTKLLGQPVKVNGVVIYNFVAQ